MQYKDLNLNKLRDDNGLDFAHYTYLKDMCTCCYNPLDFPKKYWRNGEKTKTIDEAQYILFQNADNGSGYVQNTDEIRDIQYVYWQFPMEKMEMVCKDLQQQFGDEYVVAMPQDNSTSIMICKSNYPLLEEKIKSKCLIDIRTV